MNPHDHQPANQTASIGTRLIWIALAMLFLSVTIGVGMILWGSPDLARDLWPQAEPGLRPLP